MKIGEIFDENIQKPRPNRGAPRRTPYKWDSIEIGKTFFAGKYSATLLDKVSQQARYYGKKFKRKFSCRNVKGNLLVWRDK